MHSNSNNRKLLFFMSIIILLIVFEIINQKYRTSTDIENNQKEPLPKYTNLIKVSPPQYDYKKEQKVEKNFKNRALPIKIKLYLSRDVISLLLRSNSKIFVYTGTGKNSYILGYLNPDLEIKKLNNSPETIVGYRVSLSPSEKQLISRKNPTCRKVNCKLFLYLDPSLKKIIQNSAKKEIKKRNLSKIVAINISIYAQAGYLFLTIDNIQLEGKKISIKKVYPI